MSALLAIPAQKINVCAEYGYGNRNFEKRPRYLSAPNYTSAMLLVYRQDEPLPNRHAKYRNHFTLFKSARDILVVRSETTLVFRDNDAVLLYDRIAPSRSSADRFRATHEAWDISFDRQIEYSNQRPCSFVDYELVCSGEWWFFDRGIILDGVTRYVPDEASTSMLVYYELHTPSLVKLPCEASAIPPAANTALTPNNNNTQINAFDYRTLPRIAADGILPFLNSTARPTIRENDSNRTTTDVSYQAVVPSLFWFVTRSQELRANNLSYFLPTNYTRRA